MLLIRCPWCGNREETEFRYGGQAHVHHPQDTSTLDDQAWAEYLFIRDNPCGELAERWVHTAGCRRWFNAIRDTATNRMRAELPSARKPVTR
ncbi:sarcosine oxidase subunit delta [Haloactinomyces albus]|uniref:Heterotetrameric sarcosine oxidase delta subunit n=1 Tax=Haloactinomyces albus TaxID=1352928 RepID=A0AAE3ZBY7_9ACTN|nr:sarcosine oxidase subunit delta [Haloactinomyces albus]MDR7300427.1 heterotetrameric sarcosine oxidase delta subunit [Haloactinomyces albus]